MDQDSINKGEIYSKGKISNVIAWIFIALESLLILGNTYPIIKEQHGILQIFGRGLYALLQTLVSFNIETFGNIVFLIVTNILGIGAVILSLIVLFKHKNQCAKKTIVAAIIVITFKSILNMGQMARLGI